MRDARATNGGGVEQPEGKGPTTSVAPHIGCGGETIARRGRK